MKYLRDYYVPCVVKSREYLIGYLDCLQSLAGVLSFDPWIFESCRFNEILPNDDRRSEKTDEEISEILSEHKTSLEVKENEKEEVKEDVYFEVNCVCGNYHAFYFPFDIPENGLKCELCDRILVDYTGHHDEEFEYSGNEERKFVGMSVYRDGEVEEGEEDNDEEQD